MLLRLERMLIKVIEKNEEEGCCCHIDVDAGFGRCASGQRHDHSHEQNYQDKLDHLSNCEVSLPPEVLSDAGTHGCKSIVAVHCNVNNGIENDGVCLEATSFRAEEDPATERQCSVMNDVEVRDQPIFLPENEEESIQKFCIF